MAHPFKHPLGKRLSRKDESDTCQKLWKLEDGIKNFISDPRVLGRTRAAVSKYCTIEARQLEESMRRPRNSLNHNRLITFPLTRFNLEEFEKLTLLAAIHDARVVPEKRIYSRNEKMRPKDYLHRMPFSHVLVERQVRPLLESDREEMQNVVCIARRYLKELRAIYLPKREDGYGAQPPPGNPPKPPLRNKLKPSHLKAAQAYQWAISNIAGAENLNYSELYEKLENDPNSPDDLPPNAATFATYCRAAGIKKNHPRSPGRTTRSVIRKSQL